ncbi:chymotrypsin-2 [Megalopta genalis]|uniref:chymotrypsin-2 n=1 Tax=Megalopta genalis TaxID=115081 RepID=UPI003FD2B442
MYTRAILLILGLIINVHGALVPRIVGGRNATPGKFPYQACILKRSYFICGGSIISENLILTAAHCIYGESASDIEVVVGTYTLPLWKPAIKYSPQKLIWHAHYNPQKDFLNDIGLIWLTKNIPFTENIQPIRLPSVNRDATGEKAVITGWGRLSEKGLTPYILQEIELEIISQQYCLFEWNVTDSQICTLTKISEGVCNGDSGGPLVLNGEQVGIVSYGSPCARNIPDVYTKVYSYKQWITEYTKFTATFSNATNTITKVWISSILAILTYLHFLV